MGELIHFEDIAELMQPPPTQEQLAEQFGYAAYAIEREEKCELNWLGQ